MSGITSITLGGVEVVTSDRELVLSMIASLTPTAPPKAVQSAKPSKRTTTKSEPAEPRKSSARKSKTTQGKTPAKEILASIRSAYRSGDFPTARRLCPAGWVQMFGEIDRAEDRAASSQEPKAAGKKKPAPKAPKVTKPKAETPKVKTAKPKTPKGKAAKPKTVPTGTEGEAVVRVSPKEVQTLSDWKNLYEAKVNDVLAGGSADEVALAYAELGTLVDALDTEASNLEPTESGRLVAKACFLADQQVRLMGFATV